MAKRSAASELNHDNWNEEEPPEKAGTFCKAAPDVLQSRVIKSAKRRSIGTPESARAGTNSPFASFGGFVASPKTVPSTAGSKTENSTNGSVTKSSKTVEKSKEPSGIDNKSQDYCSKIKGLNESVSKWIKSHVDSNPFCILTPIFKDYEKHLNDIETEEAKRQSSEGKKNEISKTNDSSNWKMSPTQNSSSVFQGISSNRGNAGVSQGQSVEKPQGKSPTEKSTDKALPCNPFAPGKPLTFSFGSGPSSTESKSAGFTFGSDKPFTFSNVSTPVTETTEENKASDDESEGPQVEFSPVVEEGAKYSKRCKVFVKKGSALQDRGIGTLYLKPVESSNKTQLVVRAENSLGNLLINTLVTSSMAVQRKGSNVVMMVCVPTPETEPPPVPVLLRVKTSEDADELLEKLKEYMV